MRIIEALHRTRLNAWIVPLLVAATVLGPVAGCGASKEALVDPAVPDATPYVAQLAVATSDETFAELGFIDWQIRSGLRDDGIQYVSFTGNDEDGAAVYEIRYEILDATQGLLDLSINGSPVETDEQRAEITRVLSMVQADAERAADTVPYSHSDCRSEYDNFQAANFTLISVTALAPELCAAIITCAGALAAVAGAMYWVNSAARAYDCCRHLLPECPAPSGGTGGGNGGDDDSYCTSHGDDFGCPAECNYCGGG